MNVGESLTKAPAIDAYNETMTGRKDKKTKSATAGFKSKLGSVAPPATEGKGRWNFRSLFFSA
jgi:hypothetical protein